MLILTTGLLSAGDSPVPEHAATADSTWQAARPDYAWSFPADHWSHPGYKTEWWYVTGHLVARDDPTRRFGYQFTLFRIGLAPRAPASSSRWMTGDLVMGHASITDLHGQRHVFSEVLHRAMPLLGGFGAPGDSVIAWSRAPAGTDDVWKIVYDDEGFVFSVRDDAQEMAFSLRVVPRKPLVLHGPNGYSRKGHQPTSASQYYSFTRLATEGTLELDGESLVVNGQSWLDREFGSNQLDEDQVGWDWFSLQLADGREVMLYHLRDAEGRVDFGRGTLVAANGQVRQLKPEEWRLEVLAHWRSAESGAEYPIRWRLELPSAGLQLRVEALLPDQENVSRRTGGLHYWEGAVRVLPLENVRGRADRAGDEGTVDFTEGEDLLGLGYVEMTGYGERSRPPI
jgi:predicted secreted hydrolase